MTQPNLSETYPAQSPRLAEKFRLAEQLQNTIDAEKNPNHVQRLDGSIHVNLRSLPPLSFAKK